MKIFSRKLNELTLLLWACQYSINKSFLIRAEHVYLSTAEKESVSPTGQQIKPKASWEDSGQLMTSELFIKILSINHLHRFIL